MPATRTALLAELRRAYGHARANNALKTETGSRSAALSRRTFLGGAATLLVPEAGSALSRPTPASAPRIAIVGAGIAGLNLTDRLREAGVAATLYEAAPFIGGRMQTARNTAASGVSVELGGEFIDSDHTEMLALASEFHLDLIDTQGAGETGLKTAYFANGQIYSEAEVIAAFEPLAAVIDEDTARLSDTITYRQHSTFDTALDRTPLRDYLKRQHLPRWLYEILEAAYVNEYGLELRDQSSLNFVQTIGTDTTGGFRVYGASDQRYKIRGGNDQIVKGLALRVQNHLELGHRLEALGRTAGGAYRLTFGVGHGAVKTVTADLVVLCLPFSVLRWVALRLPLPAVKLRAIRELGYGTNAKVIAGFRNRVWREGGFSGDSYARLPYQSGWDSSRGQAGTTGAYTMFAGGEAGLEFGGGSVKQKTHQLLRGLERVFPGVEQNWLRTAERAYWPLNPYTLGSYAAYRPGQWTRLRGAEGETVENLYFAGEHTSLDWQGYMNGGAESGRLTAEAILARLRG